MVKGDKRAGERAATGLKRERLIYVCRPSRLSGREIFQDKVVCIRNASEELALHYVYILQVALHEEEIPISLILIMSVIRKQGSHVSF